MLSCRDSKLLIQNDGQPHLSRALIRNFEAKDGLETRSRLVNSDSCEELECININNFSEIYLMVKYNSSE